MINDPTSLRDVYSKAVGLCTLCHFLTEMKTEWDYFVSRCPSFRDSEVVVSPMNCNVWPHRHNDAGRVVEIVHLQDPVTEDRITLQRLAIFSLVGYCAAFICSYLPMIRGSLSTPYSTVKQSKEILFWNV